MGSPGVRQVHIDRALTNLAVMYRNETYVSDKVFPMLRVNNESDRYFVFSRDNYRIDEQLRAAGAEANEITYTISQSSYVVDEYSLKKLVPDRVVRNADAPIRPVQNATAYLLDKLWIRRERAVSNIVATTTSWSLNTTLSGDNLWTTSTALPIDDVDNARQNIIENTGTMPNVVFMDLDSWITFKNHPNVRNRINPTSRDAITRQVAAQLLEVKEVVVGQAMFNSAAEGLTFVAAPIWPTSTVWVGFRNPTPDIQLPSAGYIFQGNIGGSTARVKRWREEGRDGQFVEAGWMYVPRVVASLTAMLIKVKG